MQTEATFEAVRAAIEQLEAEGKFASLDAIKALVGGNKGTIARQREAVREWRSAQSSQQTGSSAPDDERLTEGFAKIVRPVSAHLADIAPAVMAALRKELDADRESNRLATEAILADHKHILELQRQMYATQVAVATENASELERCEGEKGALEVRTTSLILEVEKMQAENVELSTAKYAALDRALALANRAAEIQSELASVRDVSNRTATELVEYRLKFESVTLALQISENAFKDKAAQCSELESKLEALRIRQAGVEEYANGVADVCRALQAATEDRLDRLIRNAESGWEAQGESFNP